jgi:hypothetical protein
MTAQFVLTTLFVVMWIGVVALLSHMSGWPKLASVYRARRPPSGRCFLLAGGKIGAVSYRGTLTIYTSPEGVYISLWPIFRFRNPPLFIPWHDIHNRREKRWLWTRLIDFDVGSPPIGTMRLFAAVFRDVPSV